MFLQQDIESLYRNHRVCTHLKDSGEATLKEECIEGHGLGYAGSVSTNDWSARPISGPLAAAGRLCFDHVSICIICRALKCQPWKSNPFAASFFWIGGIIFTAISAFWWLPCSNQSGMALDGRNYSGPCRNYAKLGEEAQHCCPQQAGCDMGVQCSRYQWVDSIRDLRIVVRWGLWILMKWLGRIYYWWFVYVYNINIYIYLYIIYTYIYIYVID